MAVILLEKMERIEFSAQDQNGLEIVRSIVFKKLKMRQWDQQPSQFEGYFDDCVELVGKDIVSERDAKERFLQLFREVFWQLIAQGVICPGKNAANPNLPFFTITDYGEKVLEEEKFIPHDPTGYLREFGEIVNNADPIVLAYLEESLRCFTTGCFLASTMTLGIASERVFLNLCDVLLNSLNNQSEKQQFQKIYDGNSMIAKAQWFENKIENIVQNNKRALPENTRTHLSGIFNLIRVQRNDIGHPQNNLKTPSRDEVYVYLRLFPQYCLTVKKIRKYLSNNKV